MNIAALNKRMDNLSTKLVDEHKDYIARFDGDSFTDSEKLLFRKIEELQKQYGVHLPPDVLKANKDLVCKASDILLKYTIGNLRIEILCLFGNPESQRDKNLFDTFLYNFLLDICICLKEANKRPLSEEDFMHLMDKYDLFGKLSRLVGNADATKPAVEKQDPDLIKTEYSEDDENEHYDRV